MRGPRRPPDHHRPEAHRDPGQEVDRRLQAPRGAEHRGQGDAAGDRAWEFFDRLLSLAIPRIRDFRGLSPRSFDGHGNYTFGVTEQLIFPEIDYDKIDTTRGMDITIVTTARTNEEGRAFLAAFGFPFRQETR